MTCPLLAAAAFVEQSPRRRVAAAATACCDRRRDEDMTRPRLSAEQRPGRCMRLRERQSGDQYMSSAHRTRCSQRDLRSDIQCALSTKPYMSEEPCAPCSPPRLPHVAVSLLESLARRWGTTMSSWLTVTVVLHSLEPPRFGLKNPYSNALITIYKVRGNMCFAPQREACSVCRSGLIYAPEVKGARLWPTRGVLGFWMFGQQRFERRERHAARVSV